MTQLIDGKYEIVRLLGEGGMGSVYEARHVGTGRRVAVKLMSAEALLKSPDIGARFEREARATAALESRHVAQVLDTGRDAATDRPYLVIELLRGEDLSQVVARLGPLPPDAALRAVAQALTGLQKAHDAGIVHRDIKPANIYLSHGETDGVVVKILDFGIAKVRADPLNADRREDVALTRTGSMLGSPLYMSPEQARSAKNLDHRCDLWAMGICLYEALAGVTPYGDVDTLGGLILEICSGRAHNVQDRAQWVSPEIARLLHRALHPHIDQRYQTAQEMLADVRALITTNPKLAPTALSPLMLVSMSPEIHAKTAERFAISGTVSPFAVTEGRPSVPLGSSTHSTFAQSTSAPRKSATAFVAAGFAAVALIGIGAVGFRYATSHPATPVAAAAATSIQVAPSAITVPATATASAPAILASATPTASVAPTTAKPTAPTTKPAPPPPVTSPSPNKPATTASGEASRKFE